MKVLITGALGHIGSRLIQTIGLYLSNPDLVLVDNLSTQRYCSLFNIERQGQVTFYECDVTEGDLTPLFSGVDVCVHLAAITDATSSVTNSDKVRRHNLQATTNVAETCAALEVPIIHLSSTSVYGSQEDVVDEGCAESDLAPQSPYAETKLEEEKLIQHLADKYRLPAVTLRFGTIFGTSPGMRFHTAVNKFCYQAAFSRPLTVWETAMQQVRPYLSVDDAVRAIAHVINMNLFDARIFNVLTCNTSVQQILDEIEKFPMSLTIELVDHPIMNQLSYHVDDSRFRSTGFTPTGSLQEGIWNTLRLLTR